MPAFTPALLVYLHMLLHPQSLSWLVNGTTTTMHHLVGGALGLLLVFRTNSAYHRCPTPNPQPPNRA